MGIFGDKDAKRLKEEVLAWKIALSLRAQVSDTTKLDSGVIQAKVDIEALLKQLDDKGMSAKGRDLVAPLTSVPEVREWASGLLR